MACYLLALLGLLWLFAFPVSAAVKIRFETRDASQKLVRSGWMYLESGGLLRVDMLEGEDPSTQNNSIIFRGDQQAMYILDHNQKAFFKLDHQAIQGISAQMEEAMRKMEEQLANLPESQRAVVEEMLKSQNPLTQVPQIEVEVRDLGMDADLHKYGVWVDENKETEVWVAPPERFGIEPELMAVFAQMNSFYEELATSAQNPLFDLSNANPFSGMMRMDGFPVRVLDLSDGTETRMWEGSQVITEEAFFEIPESYRPLRPPG